jgi:hypothetical protein
MVLCLLCGFPAELDDAAVLMATRPRCICVRCFNREVGIRRPPLPARLRQEVESCIEVDV